MSRVDNRYSNRGYSRPSTLSPAEQARRVRRAASAFKQGADVHLLMEERGFTKAEIDQAQAMLAEQRK